jgi:hypothetical protein
MGNFSLGTMYSKSYYFLKKLEFFSIFKHKEKDGYVTCKYCELRSVKMMRPKMFRTSVPPTTAGASMCAATPLVHTTVPVTR